MAGSALVLETTRIVLAILWIWLFWQNKRKKTVNLVHTMFLIFALAILVNSWM